MLLLKQIRKSLNLTQSYVAKKVGISQQSYANYENETTQAPYSILIQLAAFFNCSLDELFKKNEEPNNQINKSDYNAYSKFTKLKELRNINQKTQKDIANYIGYQQTLVSKWEKGEREPSIDALKKISKYFNVSIDYLLDNEIVNQQTNTLQDYQQEFIEYVKTMNELECFQAKAHIETLRKMQTDKQQAKELYNILKRNS